ncbi:MAG TPA: sigma-70 family RNA polymerase sigma factor [Bryobacteraceae bacterium]|nr:sigma-70 family RNA polymerase sigma factor [Bryobacteraceae bacterium]
MSGEQGSKGLAAGATAEIREIEDIFRQYSPLVFRAAYRVTGNAADAEDVLQTVFLRLMRREAGAEALEHVESYLHRAAVNTALDLVRSRQRASIPLAEIAPPAASAALAPDRLHASAEIRAWLREAVARLSPRTAEMFALRFFEGKTNPEIARACQTTEGTVAVTLSRARDRLEREFRAFLGDPS